MMAADVAVRTRSRRPTAAGSAHPDGPGVDGPQWVLEHWSDLKHVFSFVRVEDMAYDKRQGMRNVVYIVDSRPWPADQPARWQPRPVQVDQRPDLEDGLRPEGPDHVTSLSILIEGDDHRPRH